MPPLIYPLDAFVPSGHAEPEVTTGPVPSAPSAGARHAASDPQETLRKEFTQCQYCFRSRNGPGIKLMKCSGCNVECYCSKECQKRAWPMHKAKCKINQGMKEMDPEKSAQYQALRAFTKKHRPIFAMCGCNALEVYTKPERCEREVLVLYLNARPQSARRETAFYLQDAEIADINLFGPERAIQMHRQLQQAMADNLLSGMTGGFCVVLWCLDLRMVNISPVGFIKDDPDSHIMKLREPWKDVLLRHLNEGIVI